MKDIQDRLIYEILPGVEEGLEPLSQLLFCVFGIVFLPILAWAIFIAGHLTVIVGTVVSCLWLVSIALGLSCHEKIKKFILRFDLQKATLSTQDRLSYQLNKDRPGLGKALLLIGVGPLMLWFLIFHTSVPKLSDPQYLGGPYPRWGFLSCIYWTVFAWSSIESLLLWGLGSIFCKGKQA